MLPNTAIPRLTATSERYVPSLRIESEDRSRYLFDIFGRFTCSLIEVDDDQYHALSCMFLDDPDLHPYYPRGYVLAVHNRLEIPQPASKKPVDIFNLMSAYSPSAIAPDLFCNFTSYHFDELSIALGFRLADEINNFSAMPS